ARLLEESRSTNLQRQAKKWKVKLLKVRSRLIRPSFYHNAPLFVKNYSVQKKFAMARTLPPARETRALPNHLRATHGNPRFHKTPIANHLSRFVSLAAQPVAAAGWAVVSALRGDAQWALAWVEQ